MKNNWWNTKSFDSVFTLMFVIVFLLIVSVGVIGIGQYLSGYSKSYYETMKQNCIDAGGSFIFTNKEIGCIYGSR